MTNVDLSDPEAPGAGQRLLRTVAFIGMMGSGKSSIGRRLAAALDAPFRDADSEIEAAAGMKIPEIFAQRGEADFRDGERKVIARLMEGPPCVLATGGGAFMQPETRAALLAGATVVWLDAALDVLVERCARRDNRPLLQTGDPREILARLSAERNPVYAQAHLRVESRRGPHEAVLANVMAALRAHGDIAEGTQ